MAKITTNTGSVLRWAARRLAYRFAHLFGFLAAHTVARPVAPLAGFRVAYRTPPALLCAFMALASVVLVGCGNKGDLFLESTRAAAASQVEVVDDTIDDIDVTDEAEISDDEDEDADEDDERNNGAAGQRLQPLGPEQQNENQ